MFRPTFLGMNEMAWLGTVGFWEVSRSGNVKILAEMHLGQVEEHWGKNALEILVGCTLVFQANTETEVWWCLLGMFFGVPPSYLENSRCPRKPMGVPKLPNFFGGVCATCNAIPRIPRTLPETNIVPENRPKRPKRKPDRIPTVLYRKYRG